MSEPNVAPADEVGAKAQKQANSSNSSSSGGDGSSGDSGWLSWRPSKTQVGVAVAITAVVLFALYRYGNSVQETDAAAELAQSLDDDEGESDSGEEETQAAVELDPNDDKLENDEKLAEEIFPEDEGDS